MRKTKNGGLLLEVRGDQAVVDTVRSEISRAVGDEVNIRQFQQRTLVEIRDIDLWSDRVDVTESIVRETSLQSDMVNVISLRSTYGRSQTALVLLPTTKANDILASGRLKISVVYCRVRLADKGKGRCFKCLAFNHEANVCKGTDRSILSPY